LVDVPKFHWSTVLHTCFVGCCLVPEEANPANK
jgi:hypothetical protein